MSGVNGDSLDCIVGELSENSETLISCENVEQHDAIEPRAKLTITGPARLVNELANRICGVDCLAAIEFGEVE